jgi:hypothetical protein
VNFFAVVFFEAAVIKQFFFLRVQPSNDLYTRPCKDILCVRSFLQFSGQVLSGEVQVFVHIVAPFWAISHIVNDAVESDEFTRAAFACAAA